MLLKEGRSAKPYFVIIIFIFANGEVRHCLRSQGILTGMKKTHLPPPSPPMKDHHFCSCFPHSSGKRGVNTMCLACSPSEMPHLHISLGPQGGNCPHHPRLCYGKTGTRGVHRPQFIWEMYNHAASSPLATISALSEKAKQLLPCKLYLISLKNVCGWRRGRGMHGKGGSEEV